MCRCVLSFARLIGLLIPHLLRYATRSLRFLDAYRRGLNGRWAAYVAKQYRGHRVLPSNLFDGLRAKGYRTE
ncbi:hypothetical protein K438DRAFT_1616651 [Mycena galopus ATCC 62051]|nr:hypothetical protein K438DRAFT_1616651 [Mycena galopus ATCC 62051]